MAEKKSPFEFWIVSNLGHLWVERKKYSWLACFHRGRHSYRFPSRGGTFPQFSRGGASPWFYRGQGHPIPPPPKKNCHCAELNFLYICRYAHGFTESQIRLVYNHFLTNVFFPFYDLTKILRQNIQISNKNHTLSLS